MIPLIEQSRNKVLLPEEFSAALKRGFSDAVFFSQYFCGIDPFQGLDKNNNRTDDKGQIAWLRNCVFHPERILVCGNRWGKSLITAVKHLWMMFYKIRRNPKFNAIKEYRTVNIAITIEQAKIVWEEAARLITTRPQLSWALAKPPIRKPFPLIQLSDGQSFTCRSTDQPANLWGPWYDYTSYDEAACEKKPETTIPLIKTRLMDHDGILDYLSTPSYTKDWYFKLVQKALQNPNLYFVLTGSNEENLYISEEARERFAANMTEAQKAVHIRGEFIDVGGYVFKYSDVEWARNPELKFKTRIEGHKYFDGWDIATKKDCLVGITIDCSVEPFELVAFEKLQGIPWSLVYEKIRARQREYKSIVFVDITGVGDHIPEELSDIKDFIIGVNFAKPKIKTNMLINLQKILENHKLIYPHIPELVEELTFYEWEDKNLKTDCVIALALALYDPSTNGLYTEPFDAALIPLGGDSTSSLIQDDLIRKAK